MLKRNIGILIAGVLLSAQVNLAFADFPPSEIDIIWKPLPAQAKYLEERAARLQLAPVRGDTFPPSAEEITWKMLPAQARYFEQRAATLQARKSDMSAPGSE
jgi:hypothetical protein